jgi:S1-C subfamily serine protease
MQLASVLSLKEELLSVPDTLVTTVASTRAFRVFAASRTTTTRTMDGIALGVARKRNNYQLAVRLQESGPLVSTMTEAIRSKANGEVDVKYIGKLVKLASAASAAYYRARRRPLRIGSSISDVHDDFVSAGTLGCFVARRRAPHYVGILTNNHVIANENGNEIGAPVVQPGTLDGGSMPNDQVAELSSFVALKRRGSNSVDAAIGDVYDDVDIDTTKIGTLGNVSGLGDAATLPPRAKVFKVGRTTGQTEGRITAFDLDNVVVEYDLGFLRFDNQIEIEGAGNKAFSDSGDSGSLIVDESLRAIGLLFAGGDEGGSNGKGLTYANPIDKVLDALKVNLKL